MNNPVCVNCQNPELPIIGEKGEIVDWVCFCQADGPGPLPEINEEVK